MKKRFKPHFFYVNGEYFVNRLFIDGKSIYPAYFPVKEADLQKIYGLTKEEIEQIPVFVDFTLRPENDPVKYQRVITTEDSLKHLNVYDLPLHNPGQHAKVGDLPNWPNIYNLISHIAPDTKPFPTSNFTYKDLLLDYLAKAWKNPQWNLPILVLVSTERSTGKTTFLELIQLMFQTNAKLVKEKELDSQFNRYWGFANFILIDEAKIPKQLMNRIRSESTARRRGINEKYQIQSVVPSFSKFIMASNELDTLAHIDEEENRYFVIEVPPFAPGVEKKEYDKLMVPEVSNFLDYLQNHHVIKTDSEKRMSFEYDDYRTPALEKIIKGSRSSIYLTVEEGLQNLAETYLLGYPDSYVFVFSLTGFRNSVYLNKGAEVQVKKALKSLGVKSSENKVRFTCEYIKEETHTKQYHITVGELRAKFNIAEYAVSDIDPNVVQP